MRGHRKSGRLKEEPNKERLSEGMKPPGRNCREQQSRGNNGCQQRVMWVSGGDLVVHYHSQCSLPQDPQSLRQYLRVQGLSWKVQYKPMKMGEETGAKGSGAELTFEDGPLKPGANRRPLNASKGGGRKVAGGKDPMPTSVRGKGGEVGASGGT